MANALSSLRMLAILTLLTGFAYPMAVTGLAGIFFGDRVGGSLVSRNGRPVGSVLVAQKFSDVRYFWPRPSAVDFNPIPSGGSNFGPTSADLKKAVGDRETRLREAHPGQGGPPQDLIFASGSGLDPHISPEAARYQADRVATARNYSLEQRTKLEAIIGSMTEPRQFGVLGEPRVNVLRLNLALDELR